MRRTTVEANSAYGRGGGLFLSANNEGEANIVDSIIIDNRTNRDATADLWRGRGAGMSIENGTAVVTIDNSLIADNTAVAGSAGGIHVGNNDSVTIRNSTISGNTAGLDVDDTSWNGATAGGIYVENGDVTHIIHSTITDNYSTNGNASGIFDQRDTVDLRTVLYSTTFPI